MRLRNWKETVEPTIEDTLLDLHPHSLDEGFHWYPYRSDPVWVNTTDENGKNKKWRKGIVCGEGPLLFSTQAILRSFEVRYNIKRKPVYSMFTPGLYPGEMKPDTPEVRELLRQAGYFT